MKREKQSSPTSVHFRTLHYSALVILVLILLLIPPPPASGNPTNMNSSVGYDPIPYENTSVYMSSERVVIIMRSMVEITATYNFTNDGENATDLNILLPFLDTVHDVHIYLDQSEIPHEPTTIPGNLTRTWFEEVSPYVESKDLHAVRFTVPIRGNATISVVVTYSRPYEYDDGWELFEQKKTYEFSYLTSTTRYWNHTVDHAEFEFRIRKHEADKIRPMQGAEIFEQGEYTVVRMRYDNTTTPGNKDFPPDTVFVRWEDHPPSARNMCCFLALLVPVLLTLLGFYVHSGKKRARAFGLREDGSIPPLPPFEKDISRQRRLRVIIEHELDKSPMQSKAHDWNHLDRVRDRALRIADLLEKNVEDDENDDDHGGEEISIDRESLELAALLHDIDQPFNRKKDHAVLSAAKAGKILSLLGYRGNTIEKVQAIILEHSSEDEIPPVNWEGKILFDADKLDGVGIIGIRRVLVLCDQMKLSPVEMIDWYDKKVTKALPMMQTGIGRTMGEKDLELTRDFISEVRRHKEKGTLTPEVIETIVTAYEHEM